MEETEEDKINRINNSMHKQGSGTADDESKAIIYQGLNISQMVQLFRLDKRTIDRKIFENNIKPIGKRGRSDIYSFTEIAPHLIKPVVDVEEYIRRMHHSELPKHLTKEFWAGLKSKQEYELRAGMLWPTAKVVEEVGELMKLVKMSALLMVDAVERQSELSDRQREIVQRLTHGMLDDLVKRIGEKFKLPEGEVTEDGEREETADDEDL